ncbi:hypothetical protein G6F22_017102 [Rhizopus arrhizus]|nr:hypothetical protein G6F22_017102 [Rhizopus arrhizus]
MLGRAVAGRGHGHVARLGLGQRDEFRQRLGLHRRVDDEHQRHRAHDGHRREALFHVIGDAAAVQGGVDGMAGQRAHQQGVAVGLRLGDLVRADVAGGARAVLDDHRLAQRARQFLRQHAADHVGRASGRIRDDQADGLVRVRVGRQRRGGNAGTEGQQGKQNGTARPQTQV